MIWTVTKNATTTIDQTRPLRLWMVVPLPHRCFVLLKIASVGNTIHNFIWSQWWCFGRCWRGQWFKWTGHDGCRCGHCTTALLHHEHHVHLGQHWGNSGHNIGPGFAQRCAHQMQFESLNCGDTSVGRGFIVLCTFDELPASGTQQRLEWPNDVWVQHRQGTSVSK